MPASGKTTNWGLPLYQANDTISELVSFNNAMETIDEKGGAADTSMTALQNTVAGQAVEITQNKGAIAIVQGKVEDIEAKLPQYDEDTTDIGTLKTSVAANTAAVQGLDTRTTNLEINVHNLNSSMTTAQGNISSLQTSVDDLNSATTGLPALQQKVDSLAVDITADQFVKHNVISLDSTNNGVNHNPLLSAFIGVAAITANDSLTCGGMIMFEVTGSTRVYKDSPIILKVNGKVYYGANSSPITIPCTISFVNENDNDADISNIYSCTASVSYDASSNITTLTITSQILFYIRNLDYATINFPPLATPQS